MNREWATNEHQTHVSLLLQSTRALPACRPRGLSPIVKPALTARHCPRYNLHRHPGISVITRLKGTHFCVLKLYLEKLLHIHASFEIFFVLWGISGILGLVGLL